MKRIRDIAVAAAIALAAAPAVADENLFLGEFAGEGVTNSSSVANFATAIGNYALAFPDEEYAWPDRATAVGYQAGYLNDASDAVFVGYGAGAGGTNGASVVVGALAGQGSSGSGNVLVGRRALQGGEAGASLLVGDYVAAGAEGIDESVVIGNDAAGWGWNPHRGANVFARNVEDSVAIGNFALRGAVGVTNCVAIGYYAGAGWSCATNRVQIGQAIYAQDADIFAGGESATGAVHAAAIVLGGARLNWDAASASLVVSTNGVPVGKVVIQPIED